MLRKNWQTLLICIVATEIIGIVSGILAANKGYDGLAVPPDAPPGWVFPVVWTILYAMMALVAWLIFFSVKQPARRREGLLLYAVHLILIFLWPILFFRYNSLWGGLLLIIAIDILVVFIIALYRANSKAAAALMGLYLLWLLFATYLNIGTALLN